MTVQSQVIQASHIFSTTVQAYSYPFQIYEESDLEVYVDGILQTLNLDYSVNGAGNPNGGTITTLTVYSSGAEIVIKMNMPLTQNSDYVEGDNLPAETIERDLDRLVKIAQQLNDAFNKSLRFVPFSTLTDIPRVPDYTSDDVTNGRLLALAASGVTTITKWVDNPASAQAAAAASAVAAAASEVAAAASALAAASASVTTVPSAESIQAFAFNFAKDTGADDAYVLALTPPVTSLVGKGGMLFAAIMTTENTGAATLDNGGGVKTIKKVGPDGTLVNLEDGDIRAGQYSLFAYDATNDIHQLLNPSLVNLVTSQIAVGATDTPTTTSTSFIDLDEMSIDVTVKAGDKVEIGFSGTFYNNSTSQTHVILNIGGSDEAETERFMQASANLEQTLSIDFLKTGLSAGTHTFKIKWKASGDTAGAFGYLRTMVAKVIPN